MTRRRAVTGRTALAVSMVMLIGGSGCTARDASRPALRPVSLPDLARTSESARAQLRERHASLTRTLQNPTATSAELGDAYGKMGMLLMAAEYREDAEACFRNARALAPADMRWPYYLAHLY